MEAKNSSVKRKINFPSPDKEEVSHAQERSDVPWLHAGTPSHPSLCFWDACAAVGAELQRAATNGISELSGGGEKDQGNAGETDKERESWGDLMSLASGLEQFVSLPSHSTSQLFLQFLAFQRLSQMPGFCDYSRVGMSNPSSSPSSTSPPHSSSSATSVATSTDHVHSTAVCTQTEREEEESENIQRGQKTQTVECGTSTVRREFEEKGVQFESTVDIDPCDLYMSSAPSIGSISLSLPHCPPPSPIASSSDTPMKAYMYDTQLQFEVCWSSGGKFMC